MTQNKEIKREHLHHVLVLKYLVRLLLFQLKDHFQLIPLVFFLEELVFVFSFLELF
jgi:hypothetical protein